MELPIHLDFGIHARWLQHHHRAGPASEEKLLLHCLRLEQWNQLEANKMGLRLYAGGEEGAFVLVLLPTTV